MSPSRASPRRWPPSGRVTPTPRSSRWRTPSRVRCRPRWTAWPTAIRSSSPARCSSPVAFVAGRPAGHRRSADVRSRGQPSARPRPERPAGWPRTCPTVIAAAGRARPRPPPRRWPRGSYDAAVCAPIAAERYGLTALVDDIADHPGAVTRFVLVARPGALPAPTGNDKTSLVAVVGDRTGALLEVLQRVRRPRDQPDPDRVAAHPRAARRLLVLARLRGARRRPRGWARRWPRCTGCATTSASSAPTPRADGRQNRPSPADPRGGPGRRDCARIHLIRPELRGRLHDRDSPQLKSGA